MIDMFDMIVIRPSLLLCSVSILLRVTQPCPLPISYPVCSLASMVRTQFLNRHCTPNPHASLGMMTRELAVQVADAVLLVPNCIGGSDESDEDTSSIRQQPRRALTAAVLQMLAAFSPETLLANAMATASASALLSPASSSQQSPSLRVCISSLASCVTVWGPQSAIIQALVSAECLPALHSIGISIRDSSVISSSSQERVLLCARVLPQETMSAIEVALSRTERGYYSHPEISFSVDDVMDARSCLYRCICSAVEHAGPNSLSQTLSSLSLLLPELARMGPCPSPAAVDALGYALYTRLQRCSDSEARSALLLCKDSLKQCLLPTPAGLSITSFDPEPTSFILQVFARRSPPTNFALRSCLHAGLQSLSCYRQ